MADTNFYIPPFPSVSDVAHPTLPKFVLVRDVSTKTRAMDLLTRHIGGRAGTTFSGPMPRNISRSGLQAMFDPALREEQPFLTAKVDGERHLLVALEGHGVFVVTRHYQIYKHKTAFALPALEEGHNHKIVIVDVEIVYNMELSSMCAVVIDAITLGNEVGMTINYKTAKLDARLKAIDKFLINPFWRETKKKQSPIDGMRIISKRYFPPKSYREFFDGIVWVDDQDDSYPTYKRRYPIDGVVLVRNDVPFWQSSSDATEPIWKWKFPDRQTVDLSLVQLEKNAFQLCYSLKHIPIPLREFTIDVSAFKSEIQMALRGINSPVIECWYEHENGKIHIDVLREDKINPNAFLTVMGCFIDMAERVTLEDFKDIVLGNLKSGSRQRAVRPDRDVVLGIHGPDMWCMNPEGENRVYLEGQRHVVEASFVMENLDGLYPCYYDKLAGTWVAITDASECTGLTESNIANTTDVLNHLLDIAAAK